jgi:hypothetical protein
MRQAGVMTEAAARLVRRRIAGPGQRNDDWCFLNVRAAFPFRTSHAYLIGMRETAPGRG